MAGGDELICKREIRSSRSRVNLCKSVFLEYLLTVFFTIFACGSKLNLQEPNKTGGGSGTPPTVQVAICTGWTVSVLIAVSPHERGYFNPAITLALFISRRLKFIRFILYVVAQILGGKSR